MSWMQKLYDTYEACMGHEPDGSERLLPVSHAYQQAHVEITLTGEGKFESARTIGKVETPIQATEESAGRSGTKPPPHPLCDKVQYCAKDYPDWGGQKPTFFKQYEELLSNWCSSEHRHPKSAAVLAYVRSGTLITDLVREKVLHAVDGKLLTQWKQDGDLPEIFKVLQATDGERDQGDAFIRWHVRDLNSPGSAVWEDSTLQDAWAKYDASTKQVKGLCMVTGQSEISLAVSHPKRVRNPKDGAKLISANDSSGFTFRGRFNDKTGAQACGIGYEVTQKAHNALRWLIKRQSYRNGDQVIVSWATNGADIPDPFLNSFDLNNWDQAANTAPIAIVDQSAGQAFAQRLALALKGYRTRIGDSTGIVVMGLDSATPGRMAITYYRELTGSEFLERVEQWHTRFAWKQDFGMHRSFIGAPSPGDIADVAYTHYSNGKASLDEKLKKSTVERLVPCLIDGQPFPRDLLTSVVRRTSQRVGIPHWAWEKALGIACALYRGTFHQEEYAMALETERTTRDYLYGRLLALAEHIERAALTGSEKNRDTSAAKLMQRFAERPASTWLTIELALRPYKSRLRSNKGGLMHGWDGLHDQIVCAFQGNDFIDDSRLSGEFLLGYHCQREALKPPPKPPESGADTNGSDPT
jgi:CRISPR-associated protein Csd1